jgi:fructokinase
VSNTVASVDARAPGAAQLTGRVGFAAMTIVVGGEALVDLVPHAAGELRAHAGGGPYNTARTLGRLEQDVHYLGCLSDDGFGARLRAQLVEDAVKLDTAVPTPLPTTLALAELDERGAATYRFYTQGTSAPALEPEAALAALPERVDMLHVGTLGLVMEPTAMALQAVVEAVADHALIMVDPNCRPTFIGDRDTYRRSLAATLRYAHVVKVSNDDLEYLEPGAEPVDAARSLLEDGPRVALLTLGAEGAMIVTADTTETVPAPAIEVVDTIGAGDAFGGGFLAWWRLRGLDRDALGDADAVRAATTFACVVAARTCERAGASPPRLSDLDSDL